jgi:hypothetical protein
VVYNIVVEESMSVVGAPACHKEGPKFDSKPNTQDSSWCIVVDEMYTIYMSVVGAPDCHNEGLLFGSKPATVMGINVELLLVLLHFQ